MSSAFVWASLHMTLPVLNMKGLLQSEQMFHLQCLLCAILLAKAFVQGKSLRNIYVRDAIIAGPRRSSGAINVSLEPLQQSGSPLSKYSYQLTSHTNLADSFGVLSKVSKSVWTTPNLVVNPEFHSKLSRKLPYRQRRSTVKSSV